MHNWMALRGAFCSRAARGRLYSLAVLALAAVPARATLAQTQPDDVVTREIPGASDTRAPGLRLGDVYDAIRNGSPRLAAADALAAAARARVPAAGLPPDPQLQLGWMNYSLPNLAPMERVGMTQIQVMQMLPLGGKLGLSKGIARSQASARQNRAGEVWWETRARGAMLFYELHEIDQSLAVMRETLRLLSDIRKTAEAMYRVGEGRQTDVLRAQVEVARMTEDTLRMQAMRQGMVARLNALLDREPDADVATPDLPAFPTTIPPLDSLQQLAYATRPMLRAAGDELRASEQMSRLARRELLPDLQVGIQYGQAGATMTSIDSDGMPMSERRTERMGSLMIGASVPIFAGSRQAKMREEAEAMQQMASADLASMRADTRATLGEAYAGLMRARNLAQLYRTTILPQAEATVASALSAYRVGSVDFMTLLDNRMAVNKYRRELYALEADEGAAWAELEMAIGGELLDPNTVAGVQAAGGAR